MKITHVISDMGIGGAGVQLGNLVGALSGEYDTRIIVPRGSLLTDTLSHVGATVNELDFKGDRSFDIRDTQKFRQFFTEHPTDILHTHATLSARLGGTLAGIGTCISTRHCATPKANVKRKSKMQRYVYNYCTSMTVSTADFATRNLIEEGLDEKRIVTIKNGSPQRKKLDTGMGIASRRRLSIPDGALIVGCCARLERVKGQDLILRTVPRIVKTLPRVHFLFVGDGSARAEYERLAARLGIGAYVTFTGFTNDPEAYENLFYINVNSSRGTETSCLATSECMSLGIPTVASDFGGNTEMISHGVNGLLFRCDNHFSLGDRLITLLADRELYRKLSEGAMRIYREQFSVDRMAAQYRALYESLIPCR